MGLEIVLAGGVAVLSVALLLVIRQNRPSQPQLPPSTAVATRPRGVLAPSDVSALQPGDSILLDVPGEDDLILFFGDHTAVRELGGEVVQRVPGDLARIAVGADALVKAGIEIGQQQGMLVRLGKESTAAYRSMTKTVDAGGQVMGVFRDGGGKFRHVVRFQPATALQTLNGITGLLSAVAMQAQLASIQRAIADVAADVMRVERTQENLITSEMKAVEGLLRETYDAAMSSGELTDVMWDQIAGIALLVRKHDEFSALQLRDITRELAAQRSVKDRRHWLKKNRHRLAERLGAAQHASVLSAQYGALRLWRLTSLDDPSRDFYVRELTTSVPRREALVADLAVELRKAIDDAAHVGWSTRIHSPFDSRRVRRLMKEVNDDFQKVTGLTLAGVLEQPADEPQAVDSADLPALESASSTDAEPNA